MNTVKRVTFVLGKSECVKLILLLLVVMLGSFFELLGVSAILPFVNVILDENVIFNNKYLLYIYNLFNINSPQIFLVLITLLLALIYLIKNAYLIFMYNMQYKFLWVNQKKLAVRMITSYLRRPYLFHVEKNSSELQRGVQADVYMFFQTLMNALQLLSELSVCILLGIFLMCTNVVITLGVTLLLGCFMLAFIKKFKGSVQSWGKASQNANAQLLQETNQAFGGIKEIKILQKEDYFSSSFENIYKKYADSQRKFQLISIIPHPIIEAVCICSLLMIIAIEIMFGVELRNIVPQLSVFAVAAFRLLPSFNRMTNNINAILYNKIAVESVYNELSEVIQTETKENAGKETDFKTTSRFNVNIEVKNVSFKYPNTDKYVIKDASLIIKKGESVAFIGKSGAGKTTMADIILGILEPVKGTVSCDGNDIYKNIKEWHSQIGYIPQNIYLMDDTIRRNIALGITQSEINEKRLQESIKEAQLQSLIGDLEFGLDTVIGEGGIKLSGGQRQRIGIARALYNNPEILVLDEATSALDNETEMTVMEAIDGLHGSKTLIIIAHRLSTIRNCDKIYEVEDGRMIKKNVEEI